MSGQDHLQISRAGFGGGLAGGALNGGQFAANATGLATAAGGQFCYATTTGVLWWDADGTGAGARVAIATFSGLPSLHASDFILIS